MPAVACFAQELNCQVTVNTSQIQESNKSVYEGLQRQLQEFINNKKWTNDQFLNQERIECSMLINITARTSTDQFTATISIQARRPVFNSSYYSPLINHQDNDFNFSYVQDQVIEFDENSINSNLTATIAFYINVILGFDYDSFSPDGGAPYFSKAQTIVNNAQQLSERGWKAFESQRNRYWLAENLLNVQFKPFHACLYRYHRLGLDKMSDNTSDPRVAILDCLKNLRSVYNDKPGSFLLQFFFNAKADEIVNIFSGGTPDEKNQINQLLTIIDPGNISKYNSIK